MRPTTLIGLAALVVIGIIIADIWANPGGTSAAATGMATVLDPTYNALLGSTSGTGAKSG